MSNYLKSIFNLSRQSNKLSLIQSSLIYRPTFFISSKNQKILREVNQENRELYTKEQKKRLLEEENSRDIQSNFREEESVDRQFQDEPSSYFSREMDNYFKTLNGSKKEQQIDLSDYEQDEDIIKDIEKYLDDFHNNCLVKCIDFINHDQINNRDMNDLSEGEDEIISMNIQGIKSKRNSKNN